MKCDILWNKDSGFEVQDGPYGHIIDLKKEECIYQSWPLKGIPCPHTISALYYRNMDPSEYISKWYRKDIYLKTYSHYIQCVPGIKLWKEKDHPYIKPPTVKAMPGKPKRNRRKLRVEPKKLIDFQEGEQR